MRYSISLLMPDIEWNTAENNEIKIKAFIDQNNTKYNNIEELVNTIEKDSKIYCFGFQLVIAAFEVWAKENIEFWSSIKGFPYSGRPNYDLFVPQHILTSRRPDAVAKTKYAKLFYNGHEITLLNVQDSLTQTTLFDIYENPSKFQSIYNTFLAIEELEERFYYPEYESRHAAKIPKALPELSRFIFNINLGNSARDDYLLRVKGGYLGGYNYLKDTSTQEELYYCDVKSMYSYMLLHRVYPNPRYTPVEYAGYYESNLAMHHISYIKARIKPKHFPTVFNTREIQSKMGLSDNTNIDWQCHNELLGWITSVDYKLLINNYDIDELVIDKTYYYPVCTSGRKLFGDRIQEIYDLKEGAEGYEREAYKLILNTFTGSLAMQSHTQYQVDSITEPSKVVPMRKKDAPISPWDIAAFMNAYARAYIIEIATLAGFDNVHCISTDAVVVKNITPIKCYMGDKMGCLDVEKVMYNAHWWRINAYEWQDEEGNWHGKANGLPQYKYKHGKKVYAIPVILQNPKTHKFEYHANRYNIEDEYEE